MSNQHPDREDILTERRAKVVNLLKEGKKMSHIAVELGISVDCIFRDVRAVRRNQTSTAVSSIAPEDIQKAKPRSSRPQDVKSRVKIRYFCLTCTESWSGSGSWNPAKAHAQNEKHDVAQGTKEQYKSSGVTKSLTP